MALLDSWTLESNDHLKVNFGAVRALGSLGWAISAVAFGAYFDRYGWGMLPWLFLFFLLGLFGVLWRIPDGKQNIHQADEQKVSLHSVKELLMDTRYLKLIGIFIILFIRKISVRGLLFNTGIFRGSCLISRSNNFFSLQTFKRFQIRKKDCILTV